MHTLTLAEAQRGHFACALIIPWQQFVVSIVPVLVAPWGGVLDAACWVTQWLLL